MTQTEVVGLLKQRMKKKEQNISDLAKEFGVSRQYMRAVIFGLMLPSEKIGFEQVTFFRRMNGNS